jgi:ligand-binding SRPBCC domain-containing protein
MKTYLLTWEQAMPIPLQEAWAFFSSPLNLEKITPPELNFEITSPYNTQTKMYTGMMITYKVSPLWGIRLNWATEITHIQEHQYFVDEQRSGPYALWHHEHHFKEIKGGVHMTDKLTYALPFGLIGNMVNALVVHRQIEKIFSYRKQAIESMFGKFKG